VRPPRIALRAPRPRITPRAPLKSVWSKLPTQLAQAPTSLQRKQLYGNSTVWYTLPPQHLQDPGGDGGQPRRQDPALGRPPSLASQEQACKYLLSRYSSKTNCRRMRETPTSGFVILGLLRSAKGDPETSLQPCPWIKQLRLSGEVQLRQPPEHRQPPHGLAPSPGLQLHRPRLSPRPRDAGGPNPGPLGVLRRV